MTLAKTPGHGPMSLAFGTASVVSFERIAAELRLHGAPSALVRRAEQARRDEVRHARTMTRLARRFGGVPCPRDIDGVEPRSVFELALDNALEGCLRETYAALSAWEQASRASDSGIAEAMRCIAADETRHAALAWDLADWLEARLDCTQRVVLRRRFEDEYETMLVEFEEPIPAELENLAGVPGPARAGELLRGLKSGLRSFASAA